MPPNLRPKSMMRVHLLLLAALCGLVGLAEARRRRGTPCPFFGCGAGWYGAGWGVPQDRKYCRASWSTRDSSGDNDLAQCKANCAARGVNTCVAIYLWGYSSCYLCAPGYETWTTDPGYPGYSTPVLYPIVPPGCDACPAGPIPSPFPSPINRLVAIFTICKSRLHPNQPSLLVPSRRYRGYLTCVDPQTPAVTTF